MVSSSSLSEEKKLDSGLFLGVLGGELSYEVSCKLELFEVEMVMACESMILVSKLDLLLYLVLGEG